MCSPRHSVSARFSASKKNTRSRSARDGTSPYRPYAAASSSVRKLHRHTPQGQDRPASNQHTATEPLQTPRHRRPARDGTLNGGESARASSLTPQAVPLLLEPRQPRRPPGNMVVSIGLATQSDGREIDRFSTDACGRARRQRSAGTGADRSCAAAARSLPPDAACAEGRLPTGSQRRYRRSDGGQHQGPLEVGGAVPQTAAIRTLKC